MLQNLPAASTGLQWYYRSVRPITLFIPNLSGGGAERVTLRLAHGLADLGYAVDLVLGVHEGPYLQELPTNVRLVSLGTPGTGYLPILWALMRYLWRERPVVLLSGLPVADILAVLANLLSGTYTPHGVVIHTDMRGRRYRRTGLRQWLTRSLTRLLYPRVTCVLPVSHGAREGFLLVHRKETDKVITFYHPVIHPELPSLADQPLDHPWFQPGQPPVILGVGRLEELKRFDLLIRSLAQLRTRIDVRLVILGKGSFLARLRNLSEQLDVAAAVDFPGFDPNPYRYMQKAALLALSSDREGLPTVLIEALATGLPVVAMDCPSGPREILGDGQFGTLVPKGEVEAFTAALEMTLDRGRVIDEPGPGALQEHLRQFYPEYAARSLVKILEQLNIRLSPPQ